MNIAPFYKAYKRWFEVKTPRDMFRSSTKLAEEVGEVSEALFAIAGSKKKIKKLAKKGQTPEESLKEELGDVIIVVLNLATICGISHQDLFDQMQYKSIKRTEEIVGDKYVRSGKRS